MGDINSLELACFFTCVEKAGMVRYRSALTKTTVFYFDPILL